MHKGTRHIGKVPGKLPAPAAKVSVTTAVAALPKVSAKKRLSDLKDAIERAVADERYEDAARLRDEMRDMESQK